MEQCLWHSLKRSENVGERTSADIVRTYYAVGSKVNFEGRHILHTPIALSEMLLALDFFLDRPKEIVIVTPEGKEDAAEPFLQVLRRRFLPNRVLIVTAEGNRLASLSQIVPGVRNKTAIDGKATAYVCDAGNCQLPTTDPAVFSEQLRQADTESLR